jgi:RHS repeat-associated protein
VNTGSTLYIQYAYDAAKNLRPTSMTYPSGTTVNYAYGTSGGIDDLASRPVTIANGSTTLATYQYTGSGKPMKTTYNQPNISLAYANGSLDRFGRIIDHAWKNSGGTSLVQIKHGYDYAGNRTYREDVAATNAGKTFDELYAYDGVNQLVDMQRGTLGANKTSIASGKNYQDNFAFDKTGNWSTYKQDTTGAGFSLTQARTHTKANEIATIAGASTSTGNDANGNMTKVVKPDNWSAAYTLVYDAWNRLVQVKDGSITVATYGYNGLNHRVKKTVGSETRLFYFNDQWQCVEEYVGSTCDVRFVWGLRYIDDLVTYRKGSTDYYVIQDANWNVVAWANTFGTVQERYSYSAFGKLNVFDASFTPKSASTFNLTRSFTGQVLDNETGLMLYRNRVYHSTLGRFIQRDPIEYEADDVNLMRYVRNRISIFSDLYGLQSYYPPAPIQGGAANTVVRDPTLKRPSPSLSDIGNSLFPNPLFPNLQNRPWGPISQPESVGGLPIPLNSLSPEEWAAYITFPHNGYPWNIGPITKWPPGAKICGPKYDIFGDLTVQPIFSITGNPEISFEKWHREIERIFLPDRWKNGYDQYIPNHFGANRPEYGLQFLIEPKILDGKLQWRPEVRIPTDKNIPQWKSPIHYGNDKFYINGEIHGNGNGVTGIGGGIGGSW